MPIPRRPLLALALALAACPHRVVVVGGEEMTPEEADARGSRELEAARAEARSLKPADAAERFATSVWDSCFVRHLFVLLVHKNEFG